MSRRLVYLASPYSHPDESVRQARFEEVCRVAGRLLQLYDYVFSPIVHCHPIALVSKLPTDYAFWRGYCEATLPRSDALVVAMLDGWQDSVGVRDEIRMAEELGMRIEYVDPRSMR